MSKLVSQRYELAVYDDAQGVLVPTTQVPPTYPPTLDAYQAQVVQSVTLSYATRRLSGTTATPLVVQAGSTLVLVGDAANTTLLSLQQAAAPTDPSGTTAQLFWPVGPGQTVTLPGALNSGVLTVQPVTSSFVNTTAAWSLTVLSYL